MATKFKVGDKVFMYRFYDEDDDNYKTDLEDVLDDFYDIFKNKTVLTIRDIRDENFPILVKEVTMSFKEGELKLIHTSWKDRIED